MTEISFLIDLLLNHKLPKATRDLVASRIKDVELNLPLQKPVFHTGVISPASMQTPSTIAAMARHADPSIAVAPPPEMPPIPPVAVVAQTPATAAAMNSRNQAISDSINGRTDKLTGRPRKF